MMKTLYFITMVFSLILLSCSSDSETDITEHSNCDTENQTMTYTANVAPIISNSCLSCHGATPSNGATTSYNTYAKVKNAATQINSRINNTNNLMPKGGPQLPQATRDIIQQWITDGKLEN